MKASFENDTLTFTATNEYDKEFLEFVKSSRAEIIVSAIDIVGIDKVDNMFVCIPSGALEVK